MLRTLRRMLRKYEADPLDKMLFRLPDGTPFNKRMLMQSICIIGAAGSGKSSGSGLTFALAVVGMKGSGGLILASKPEDREWWEKIFKRLGRSKDLIIFSPNGDQRFNVLGSLGGDARTGTNFLLMAAETLKNADSKGGGGSDGMFWEQMKELHFHDAFEVIRLAKKDGEGVTTSDIADFINTAANDPKLTRQPESIVPGEEGFTPEQLAHLDAIDLWRKRFHHRMFEAAYFRDKTRVEQFDFEQAQKTWLTKWPSMDNKLRSSITAEMMGTLHVLNSGIVRDLLSTETTVTPKIMREGKWVLVDMPIREHGESGRMVNAIWKYATQREILKYKAKPGDTSSVTIWSDEYQNLMNSHDAVFLAETRSHLGNMVVLTQSLPSFYSSMGGERGQNFADALLTNFGSKIFHTVGDSKTAEYASSLLGKRLEVIMNGNPDPEVTIWDEMMGRSRMRHGYSQQYAPKLQPEAFLSGLRCGGSPHFKVDGWLIRTGAPMLCGETYQLVEFDQRA